MKSVLAIALITGCLFVVYLGVTGILGDSSLLPEELSARTSGIIAGAAAEDELSAEVRIDNFAFDPPSITVKAGTKVTWVNRDDIPHQLASDGADFKSKRLDTGDSFVFTVTQPGTYNYVCTIHPTMKGKIVVE